MTNPATLTRDVRTWPVHDLEPGAAAIALSDDPSAFRFSNDPEIQADVLNFVRVQIRRGMPHRRAVESGLRHAAWLGGYRRLTPEQQEARWQEWRASRRGKDAALMRRILSVCGGTDPAARRTAVQARPHGPAPAPRPLRVDAYGRPALDLERETVEQWMCRLWRFEKGIVS